MRPILVSLVILLGGCSNKTTASAADAPLPDAAVADAPLPDAAVADARPADAAVADAPLPDARTSCGDPPPVCAGRCLTHVETFTYASCCDSTTCNCRPSTLTWDVWFCDPPLPDGPTADAP